MSRADTWRGRDHGQQSTMLASLAGVDAWLAVDVSGRAARVAVDLQVVHRALSVGGAVDGD